MIKGTVDKSNVICCGVDEDCVEVINTSQYVGMPWTHSVPSSVGGIELKIIIRGYFLLRGSIKYVDVPKRNEKKGSLSPRTHLASTANFEEKIPPSNRVKVVPGN